MTGYAKEINHVTRIVQVNLSDCAERNSKEKIWKQKKEKKNIQQQVFAGGHPPNY
jgi:hypothetical protein